MVTRSVSFEVAVLRGGLENHNPTRQRGTRQGRFSLAYAADLPKKRKLKSRVTKSTSRWRLPLRLTPRYSPGKPLGMKL